ncbi:MAG: NHL repeat-containing protein, partial [Coriobacteriia bacterium]|nr:NHL repeat-containing protein [Coriobacteriia bacterium]
AGGLGEGEFMQPEAIDLDRSGNLYIAESRARKVIVFDAEGRFVREWGVDYQPRGIAVSAGSIYVLGEGAVYVYTTTGAETLRFGTRGAEPGQIDAYLGIEVDRGTIYVADSFNRRIQAFDRTGELLWARPESATPRSVEMTPSAEPTGGLSADDTPFAWDLPQDIVIDGAGRLVVVDAFRYEIVVLDPVSGEVLGTHGGFGRNDGLFNRPTSIDYDAERDWFVIADTDNARVQIVRIPGSGATALAGIRRMADSPARWLVPSLIFLAIVLVVSLVQWRRTAVINRLPDAVGGE